DTPIGPPPATNPVALPPGRLGVALHDVTFAYAPRDDEPATNVLTSLTLTIPPGQHIALVGESGAGKTTCTTACSGSLRCPTTRWCSRGTCTRMNLTHHCNVCAPATRCSSQSRKKPGSGGSRRKALATRFAP
ncbi:MAG: ATP-binding cassette domain-containing protein, partial [Actinobacteria bacterium]|nr:ATP-binding cassette domain-containing protein [Actinomycetota bacterium]